MADAFGTPQHWRARAQEARAIAEQMDDPEARRTMLDIAERYEKIARHTEAKLAGRPPRDGAPDKSD